MTSFLAALGLAIVHLLAGKLQRLPPHIRELWLSVTGGFTVAFVMVYLLPELAQRQLDLERSPSQMPQQWLVWLEHHVYVLALLGVLAFYGLERLAKHYGQKQPAEQHLPATQHPKQTDSDSSNSALLFWAHVSSFAAYNLVIGYLVVLEASHWGRLVLFFVAIALHFIVLDFSLRGHYPGIYHRIGRWILAIAILAGWLIGVCVQVPSALVSIALAFLSGGIILNVLKEELPEEKQSRYWPFLCGAGIYTLIAITHAKLAG